MKITTSSLPTIGANDLRCEAKAALARGESVELLRESIRRGNYTGPVETVIIDNNHAGQVTNGDARWGTWNAAGQYLTLDEPEDDGRWTRLHPDGTEELV